ncbi:MAG: hypothetical protein CMM98_03205 [Rickettsiales bacterium]|nr:hypothetical protein [Rickettsiales bacterium]|tara:strand:+ start:466 stop:1281 length:816 start_codon:yes stop_codon:yes gene_type:complete
MLKKLLIVGALAAPMIHIQEAKSFEFPEKPPFGELSANVSYYTNYIWRGEEQTGGIALQGGFDYSVSLVENYLDAYVGTWAANLNTNGHGMELDYYGGFTGAIPIPTIEDYFSYDIGMLYYDYPGASSQENDTDADATGGVGTKSMEFLEWYGSVGISNLPADLSLSYYFGYSPTGFSNNYDYTYHNVGAEIPVPGTPFTLYGHVGFTDSDIDDATTGYGFTDYKIGASTSAFGLDWGVEFTTTGGYAAAGEDKDTTLGGDHVVGYVSASF